VWHSRDALICELLWFVWHCDVNIPCPIFVRYYADIGFASYIYVCGSVTFTYFCSFVLLRIDGKCLSVCSGGRCFIFVIDSACVSNRNIRVSYWSRKYDRYCDSCNVCFISHLTCFTVLQDVLCVCLSCSLYIFIVALLSTRSLCYCPRMYDLVLCVALKCGKLRWYYTLLTVFYCMFVYEGCVCCTCHICHM